MIANKIPIEIAKKRILILLAERVRKCRDTMAALDAMQKQLSAGTSQAATEEICSAEYAILLDAIDFEAAAAIVAADDLAQSEASAQIYEAAQMATMMAADDYNLCLANQG